MESSGHPHKIDELNKKVGRWTSIRKTAILSGKRMVQLKNGKKEKERVLLLQHPILNRPECFQCHDKGKKFIES